MAQPNFLGLPAELRLKVYRHAFRGSWIKATRSHTWMLSYGLTLRGSVESRSILLVCCQLHMKSLAILGSSLALTLAPSTQGLILPSSFSTLYLRHIQELKVDFHSPDQHFLDDFPALKYLHFFGHWPTALIPKFRSLSEAGIEQEVEELLLGSVDDLFKKVVAALGERQYQDTGLLETLTDRNIYVTIQSCCYLQWPPICSFMPKLSESSRFVSKLQFHV